MRTASTTARALLLIAVLTYGCGLSPQEKPTPTFHAQTELVLVPTVVTDGSGHHVTGLKKEDFAVFQDGKQQSVAVFEEITTSTAPFRPPVSTKNEVSNFVSGPTPQRLAIIVLDIMHTTFEDKVYAHRQIIKYLASSVHADQPVALISLSGREMRVIHNFTTDPKVLVKALQTVHIGPQDSPVDDPSLAAIDSGADSTLVQQETQGLMDFQNEAQQQIQSLQLRILMDKTLKYLQQLAHAFAGVPGRKTMVWVASRPPFTLDDFAPDSPLAGLRDEYERTLKLLNDSQVAIYPVDARGLVTPEYVSAQPVVPTGRTSGALEAMRRAIKANQVNILGFRSFADMTGGRALLNRNDLDNSVREALSESSDYYLLGYYLNPADRKVGWHKLSVKVAAKNAHVRARGGFLMPGDRDSRAHSNLDLMLALTSPLDYTGIHFTARWLGMKPSPTAGKTTVQFEFYLPPGTNLAARADANHLALELTAVAVDGKGTAAAQQAQRVDAHLRPEEMAKAQSAGMAFSNQFDLAPGVYNVRFVVRDALTGRMGTVTAPLKLE